MTASRTDFSDRTPISARTPGGAKANARTSVRTNDRRSTLQTRLTIALMVLLALAPLPLGSNRPVFWALGAGLLGGVGAVYFLSYARLDVPLRAMPRWLTWAAVPSGLYLGWIVIQALPLGLGGAVMLPSGLSLTPATISLTPDASCWRRCGSRDMR